MNYFTIIFNYCNDQVTDLARENSLTIAISAAYAGKANHMVAFGLKSNRIKNYPGTAAAPSQLFGIGVIHGTKIEFVVFPIFGAPLDLRRYIQMTLKPGL